MTATPGLRPDAASEAPIARAHRSERLRRQLFAERAFFIAVIALLTFALVRQGRALTAYQITVDGRPVALVAERATADKLFRELRGNTPEARFRQATDVRRVDPRAPAVLTEREARAALTTAINVIVPAHVILVNGRVAAAVESREQAEQALTRLRAGYAGSGQQARFKESVRIEQAEIPRAQRLSPDQAFQTLAGERAAVSSKIYTVKRGDTAWGIANTHGLTVERLALLNPRADLARLQMGQALTIAREEPLLTVVTTEERTELEIMPHSMRVTAAPDLPKGQRRVLAEGRDGQKTVRYRVTLENGKPVKRVVMAETVMRPPRAERVLVGTGAAAVGVPPPK
jgi:LysM repeat protein